MQQSLTYQVLAATEITNGNGGAITPDSNGIYNLYPDSYNKNTGYRVFDKFNLEKGDVANFIFQWLDAQKNNYGNATDIDTFVGFVNNQANINGIVNALASQGGAIKSNGHLVIVSPKGMVVGSSGVLNVGSLSVLTPTESSYNALKNGLPLEAKQNANHSLATETTARDLSTLQYGNPTAVPITINGKVVARGDVILKGDTINVGDNAKIYAGVANNTLDALKYPTNSDTIASNINTIFDTLVNTDNMNVASGFSNANGNIVITSTTGTSIGTGAKVRNFASKGDITITNTGADGISIAGEVSNPNGALTIRNENATSGLLVDTTGLIKSGATTRNQADNSTLLVYNEGTRGMDIKGKVLVNHNTKANTVNFINKNSDMTIGSTAVNQNIESNADVNIAVTNGNLLNNGVAKTLIYTTNGADLNATVTNGAIGKEVGPCADGVCTGVGPSGRDLTKSVNTSIDGVITATSTKGTNTSLINMASLDKNMHVNQIKADGRVILLADDATNKGATAYSIVNRTKDAKNPNVEGTGISLIASGNIGEAKTDSTKSTPLTFRQNGYAYNPSRDDAQLPHEIENVNKSGNGVDMLAIGNIDVKGMDAEGGAKLDTKACAIISRTGDINAEFSGNVYVGETTAANNINLTTRGKNMYVEHLGEVPSYAEDYYGPNTNIHPTRAKLVALDLGTKWIDSEKPAYKSAADSTIIVKNGTLKGDGHTRLPEATGGDQDLMMVADNAYAGGYYFNMGKHRNGGVSTVVKDSTTSTLKNANNNDVPISIRTKAVRPDDVTAIGKNPEDRNYYYGGSEQGEDQGYDGFTDPSKKEQRKMTTT